MEMLNVRAKKGILEKLKRLVKKKVYKNKSEAVRKILEGIFSQ